MKVLPPMRSILGSFTGKQLSRKARSFRHWMPAFVGVTHADDPLTQYLIEMRDYMPPRHRAFLAALEERVEVAAASPVVRLRPRSQRKKS